MVNGDHINKSKYWSSFSQVATWLPAVSAIFLCILCSSLFLFSSSRLAFYFLLLSLCDLDLLDRDWSASSCLRAASSLPPLSWSYNGGLPSALIVFSKHGWFLITVWLASFFKPWKDILLIFSNSNKLL